MDVANDAPPKEGTLQFKMLQDKFEIATTKLTNPQAISMYHYNIDFEWTHQYFKHGSYSQWQCPWSPLKWWNNGQ